MGHGFGLYFPIGMKSGWRKLKGEGGLTRFGREWRDSALRKARRVGIRGSRLSSRTRRALSEERFYDRCKFGDSRLVLSGKVSCKEHPAALFVIGEPEGLLDPLQRARTLDLYFRLSPAALALRKQGFVLAVEQWVQQGLDLSRVDALLFSLKTQLLPYCRRNRFRYQ